MPLPPPHVDFPAFAPSHELIHDLLSVSLTGIIFYTPIYSSEGEIVDFTFVYLNLAAQRMMGLTAQPMATHKEHWPLSTFACLVEAYQSGESCSFEANYQAGGQDHYYRLAARRSGQGLLVSLTDATDQPRAAIEEAFRASQVREQAALAETERQRQQLQAVLHQAPVAIALLDGPEYRIALANPAVCEIWARSPAQLMGKPLLEAMPELQGQGIDDLLDGVLQSGEPFFGTELPFQVERYGQLDTIYFNFVYQPQRDATGKATGVLVVANDVTEVVMARQRMETQERQTALLNQELEVRVQERTAAALVAQEEVLAAARRQMQERETFYQVFEQTPACIGLLQGPEHRFVYVNAAYQQLFPGRQLVGLPVAEALPETAEQGFVALLDAVYRTGETFFGTELLLRVEQADGQPAQDVYFTFTYQAYHENGQIVGISIFAYDVTEHVLARQQREAQQRQLRELFLNAPDPIIIFDGPDLVCQLVNTAYQRVFPGRSFLGKPVREALPELVGKPIFDELQRVYETGEPYIAHELRLLQPRHEDGPLEEIYWTFSYQARRNEHGNVTGVLVFAHEVTEQVRARRIVEAREESFRLLADYAPATLWVTAPGGNCTYLSQQWYTYTGQTEAEGLGLGWTQAIHPDDAEAAGKGFLEANARRVPYHSMFRLRRHDGVYRWVTDDGRPRFGEDGAYAGMVGTVIDVHQQKLGELALQRLTIKLRTARDKAQSFNTELQATNEQLTRTNVDLDNFIYTASHDLKAPISNIEGLLYLLREELPAEVVAGEHVESNLRHMLDAVERFKRTIEHLTAVSKLQKEHAPTTAAVDLAAVVEDVRQDLTPLLQETNARLTIAVDAFPPVRFSEKNLRSVIYNLLSNALKYHSPDRRPHVDVRAHVRPGYTVLEVHDNGLGIAPAHLPKLFAMFQRFHSHVEGTGIGLYMVKRMVENVGGRIEVHSLLGAGTTFFVHLPHATPIT